MILIKSSHTFIVLVRGDIYLKVFVNCEIGLNKINASFVVLGQFSPYIIIKAQTKYKQLVEDWPPRLCEVLKSKYNS